MKLLVFAGSTRQLSFNRRLAATAATMLTGKIVGILSDSPGALGGLRSQSHLVPLLLNAQRMNSLPSPANHAFNAIF